jgi:O-antigen/teichoic acid export membrane protein
MAESTLKQKTANGLFWGGLSNIVQQVIQLVFGIVLARLLTQEDYGTIGVLSIFAGIAAVIINSGFSVALVNKKNATHDDYNAVFWFSFFTGLILYVILFFCAPLIAEFYRMPELTALSRVVFLNFFIGGMTAVSYAVMFQKLMVRQQAIIEIIALLISLSVGLFLAFKGFSYWSLAIQTLLQTLLGTTLRFIIAPWKPTWNIRFAPLKTMFSFSVKIFFTNIFQTISGNIFSVLLGKFYTKTAVGDYGQGYKWAWMGQQSINGMITSVAQPVLVQVGDDTKRQVYVFRKLLRFGAFVSFPLLLGLAFVGREFIVIALGEKWLLSVPYLQLFCIWNAFAFLNTYYINLLYTHGKSTVFMNGTIVVGVLQLIVVASLYSFGIFPMLTGYLMINFVGLGIWQYYTHKLIGLQLRDVLKDIFPYLVITLGCFFVAWLFTKNIVNLYTLFLLKIAISGVLYIFILKCSHSVMLKESMDFFIKKKK